MAVPPATGDGGARTQSREGSLANPALPTARPGVAHRPPGRLQAGVLWPEIPRTPWWERHLVSLGRVWKEYSRRVLFANQKSLFPCSRGVGVYLDIAK